MNLRFSQVTSARRNAPVKDYPMPQFMGERVAKDRNQTAFDELYEFNVVAPLDGDFDLRAVLPAFVTPEVDRSHIAEELARKFGARHAGDTIEMALQEVYFDGTTMRFSLPVQVMFATKNRGSEYIQIGLWDLEDHFDWRRYENRENPNDRFLVITRKPDSDRDCVEQPETDFPGHPAG